jgi:hypothetical protein
MNDHTVFFGFSSHCLCSGIHPESGIGWYSGPVEIVYNRSEAEWKQQITAFIISVSMRSDMMNVQMSDIGNMHKVGIRILFFAR